MPKNIRIPFARRLRTVFLPCTLAVLLSGCAMPAFTAPKTSSGTAPAAAQETAAQQKRDLPGLIVTNDPAPEVIYRRGSRDTVLSPNGASPDLLSALSPHPVETLVTRKAEELQNSLHQLQHVTENAAARLHSLQNRSDAAAAKYYEVVAEINTQLQGGTTPGNPILVNRWNVAQDRLQNLAQTSSSLNSLATDLRDAASRASYLQDNVRAAYGLSGAVKEDHEKLRVIEDGVNQNIVEVDRLLTAVNDETSRRAAYLRSENLNLQTLSLSIAQGELYGQNLTNSLFKKATDSGTDIFGAQHQQLSATRRPVAPGAAWTAPPANDSADDIQQDTPSRPHHRPLVIIRFDRPNVDYQQALYTAVNEALQKYPSAKFDLVAVSAARGNPAQVALASTSARKNGESVLRALTQMGLPLERINLSAASSQDVRSSEVHIYIR